MKITKDFYLRGDVVLIARELLGMHLFTRIGGELTGGIIMETEAYAGVEDRASHAWKGRRTARTEVMFAEGGIAYVYLCYGIHSLFNIVTAGQGLPHAVLVRGVLPTSGLDIIHSRAGAKRPLKMLGTGPGRTARILGIHYSLTGTPLTGDRIWLENRGVEFPQDAVSVTPRIGVDYAGNDALLPYRFVLDTDRIREKE